MQILSSGSFVNLENGEKIEQLIFTAREIANAAVETEGFASGEENNRRLALEIWQGAEYMCREHEEARVKDIFINNFLARLEELEYARGAAKILAENSAGESTVTSQPLQPKDEFLGFVSQPETVEQRSVATESGAVEDAIETTAADIFRAHKDSSAEAGNESDEEEIVSGESLPETNEVVETREPESEIIEKPLETGEINAPTAVQNKIEDSSVPGAVSLPEKEPYQFDKCTVTTIIQLLPVEAEHKRRAVISVRTHDFAPQIWTLNFASETGLGALMPVINEALNRYCQELPLKVMDKLKREKNAGSKRQTTPNKPATSGTKSSSGAAFVAEAPENKAADETATTLENKPTANSDAKPAANKNESLSQNKSSLKTAKPQELSQQGSLFGF